MDYSPLHQSFRCTPKILSDSDSLKNIEAWLKSFQPDSPANHSAKPEVCGPATMSETDGRTPFVLLERSSPNGFFWKTLQGYFPGLMDTLEQFSETWPRAGMMLAGACYRLPKWQHRIREIGYGFWPTPTASDDTDREPGTPHLTRNGTIRHVNKDGQQSFMRLSQVVKLWPTPNATDGSKAPKFHKGGNPSLPCAVEIQAGLRLETGEKIKWPTPTVNGNRNRKGSSAKSGDGLTTAVKKLENGGSLNPEFVEWLMGWPIGWTALEPLAADKFQQWLEKFGDF